MTSFRGLLNRALDRLARVGAHPADDRDVRLRKALLFTASRMESAGTPGSDPGATTHLRAAEGEFLLEPRSTIAFKGMSEMETWYSVGAR